MKPIRFIRSAKEDLAAFPKAARGRAGQELFMLQVGREPDDWKPLPAIGPGAREIRVRAQKTAQRDLELAKLRYRIASELSKGGS